MPRTIRYDRRTQTLRFGATERDYHDLGYVFHRTELAAIKAADYRVAMMNLIDAWSSDGHPSDTVSMYVSEEEFGDFDDANPRPGPIEFEVSHGSLTVTAEVAAHADEDPFEPPVEMFTGTLQHYLRKRRATLRDVSTGESFTAPFTWRLHIDCSIRSRTLEDLYSIASGAVMLLSAAKSGELTRETTLDLLRAGNAEVLIGQQEGPWLDVKSSHYDLASTHGKISLAQAVARFANAEHGGIVVVGMRGKKVPSGEIIHSLCPVPLGANTVRKYQGTLEHHLYPPPDFLEIETFMTPKGGMVLVHVPPQPEELKPFLVHGAIVDGKIEGAFISIVRRRGEGSIPITAAAIHATLAAGRALFRRGQMPD
ncbi:ATP-binding protein [Streptomyces sp. TP-A0874]|uniref:ATP-binding protein n=1 Tax=Streptomyces sp. TP-A0874 TaxID=549819 RepID=UPI000AA32A52|nr:ATP-binding protein [Streptomyces sp. TP-A0874]